MHSITSRAINSRNRIPCGDPATSAGTGARHIVL
jgi:hypothetical protein